MKTRFKFISIMFLVVLLGATGCSSSAGEPAPTSIPAPEVEVLPMEMPTTVPEPTAVPEPTVDPAADIVLSMIERINAEDYAAAAAYFADDAMIYLVGMPPTGMEIYRGSEQYHKFLEECCAGQNFEYEVTPDHVTDGVVYAEGKTWMDFTRALGVAPNSWHEAFVVSDGKITKYISTINEESLAVFKPALREALPEAFPAAMPADENPVTEINITIVDGTCAYDGPLTLQAGDVTINMEVQDQTAEKYAVSFFTLDEDRDMFDLMASTNRPSPPSWARMVFLKELEPNESQTYENYQIKEGLLYMVCWSGPPDVPIGNAGPFTVVPIPAAAAPTGVPTG